MKKYLVLALILTLPFAWIWAAEGDVKNAPSSEKWQPVYGPKGDLLNPEPGMSFTRTTTPKVPELPVITTNILTQDFEETWDCTTPPTGWTIIDNGTAGTQVWYNQDWHQYYYSSSGFADTVARIYYSPNMEEQYDDWLITSGVPLPGAATACSLTFKSYYNDYSTSADRDTAFILVSTDGGSNWAQLDVWGEDHGSSSAAEYSNYDVTSYAGQTVNFAFQVKTFGYVGYLGMYYWYIDSVGVWSDATPLLMEDFNGWGPYGDNPPSGWSIIDNGTPTAAVAGCDNNDWYKYTAWSSGIARVYYNSSNYEFQDEWMISPTFAIGAGNACTLSVAEYYYHSTSTESDHGYIKVSTDGGTTWPYTIGDNNSTKGSSSTKNFYLYSLNDFNGESNLKVAFNFVNEPYGLGDYWYLDDVSIDEYVLLSHDVATTAINSPVIGIEGLDIYPSVNVTNLGLNTESFTDSARIEQPNSSTLFYENFSNPQSWDGTNPPVNVAGTWAITDSGSAPGTWDNTDWHAYYYSTWADTVARIYYASGVTQDAWLISPSLDVSSAANVHLTFKTWFNWEGTTDTAYIYGTTDNWTTTHEIAKWAGEDVGSSSAPAHPDFNLTWAVGSSTLKIAFRYVALYDLYWYLDDVELYEALTPTLIFSGEESVSSLASLATQTVDYTSAYTDPSAGDYVITTFTNLGTDEDNSNDTMSSNFTVYPHFDSGGPDAGNYHWVDNAGNGPAFNWYDISGTGTPVVFDAYTTGDDRRTSSRPLGFSFFFYGSDYTSVYISENGFASFDTITGSEITNYGIPSASGQDNLLALLWDDLKQADGSAYYETVDYDSDTDLEFILQFDDWQYYSSSLTSTIQMQLILDPTDSSIVFQYNQHGPDVSTSHTVGIENQAGDAGLEYIYNGTPFGNTPVAGLAITYRYVLPAIDAALTSVDEPTDGATVYNGTVVTPTITVTNYSDNDFTIPVTFIITDAGGDTVYNQSETTALITGGGGTLQHSFTTTWNADTDGDYDVEAYTSLTGDANDANDLMNTSFTVATHYSTGGPDDFGYRFVDNLGGGAILEDPPVFNWIDLTTTGPSDTAGTSSGTLGHFAIGFPFEFYGVSYDTVYINGYGYISFGGMTSSSGNDCPLPNSSTPNEPMIAGFWDYAYPYSVYDGATIYATFYSPDTFMVIQYHNMRYSTYYDDMDFEIILYPNGNFITQYKHVGSPATSGNYGYGKYETVGIEDYDLTNSGLVYICNDDPLGNRLVDSLAIKWYIPVFAHDVVADQFVVPATSTGLTGVAFTPEVSFINNGTSDETNVPVYLYIDPGAYADTQTIATLDSGTSVSQAFSSFTPTTGGTYTLTAVCDVAGDEDPASDTLVMTYTAYDLIIDFEADDGGYLEASGDWEWGAPTSGPGAAYSGSNVWATNLSGNYTSGLQPLVFPLEVGSGSSAFGFASWYYTEGTGNAYDGCNVAVSTDDGTTWTVLSTSNNVSYTKLAYTSNPLYPDSVWCGPDQQAWEQVAFDLSAYADSVILVRLALGADGSVYYPGWYVDDLSFANCEFYIPDNDVAAMEFIVPPSSGTIDPFMPEVSFANLGRNDQTSVPVYLYIDPGAYADTQTIATLDSGTAVSQQFAQFTPPSNGTYTFTAVSDLSGDEVPENDTLMLQFTAYDEVYDFEADDGGLGATNDWQWGTPSNVGPPSAHSGSKCWATIIDGNRTSGYYAPDGYIYSNLSFQLDLGLDNDADISFYQWYQTSGSTYDSLNVLINTGSGDSLLSTTYGTTADWQLAVYDLSTLTGVVDFTFQYFSRSSIDNPGWYIDDIALNSCAIVTPDIDVTPLTVTGEADPGFADYDTITVSNTGDGQVNFTATAVMDPYFTDLTGQQQPLYALDDALNIRRVPEVINFDTFTQYPTDQKEESTEKIDVPMSSYSTPTPLPVIDINIAYENFDDGLLPTGWSIVDGGTTADTWMLQSANACSRTSPAWTIDWMIVDSDCAGSGNTLDEQLLTAYYDCSTFTPVHLAFNHYFDNLGTGDSCRVEVRNGSTGTWNLVAGYHADVTASEDYDITSLIGAADSVQVRFWYWDNGGWDWYWGVDDFLLFQPETPWLSVAPAGGIIGPAGSPIDVEVTFDADAVGPGIYTGHVEIASNDPDEGLINVPATFIVGGLGTVSGQVTDANTTNVIEGAIVTATWVSSTTVVDTTDSGGNYSMDITPGTVNVTVEYPGYFTDSDDVTVTDGGTTTHNVALGAPIISMDETDVSDTVAVGDTMVYSRYVHNIGTAPLSYSVYFDLNVGALTALDIKGNTPSNIIVNQPDPTGKMDIAPLSYFNGQLPVITAFMDSVYVFDAEVSTGDDGCLGMEFDGENFWVTGRNAAIDDVHKLHKYDRWGNLLATYDQGTSSVWGWRDMAWDGEYLYASDEDEFAKIDPATGAKVDTLPRPSATGLTVLRALAYDPATDHFWTGNFSSSDIIEFDRTGAIINQYANTHSTYGMAWDDVTAGGPYLWVFSQNGTPAVEIAQFDPVGGVYTGVTWQSALPTGHTDAIAGGACFTTDWDLSRGVLFVLGQGTPTDFVYGYEIDSTGFWLRAQSGGSGSVAAGDSALIEYLVDFRGDDIVPDSTYEADANIGSNDPYGNAPSFTFSIYAELAGCDYIAGDVNGVAGYNGLDITYGVAYFKGGPVPHCPFGSCGIPPCDVFYYCGTVNGDCAYNGLDVTYGVAYFKGGPGPVPCDQCPPIGGPASIGDDELRPAVQPAIVKPKVKSKGNVLQK